MPSSKKDYYIKKGVELRQKMLDKLDVNGVLFYPTFPQPAMKHCESPLKMSGVMYTMFFNLMGFPSTHVPVNFIQFFSLAVCGESFIIYHHKNKNLSFAARIFLFLDGKG